MNGGSGQTVGPAYGDSTGSNRIEKGYVRLSIRIV